MIGKLKSKNVRTVHEQKVVRLRVDIPFSRVKEAEVDQDGMLEYLDQNVGREIGFIITALTEQEQERIDGES